MAPQFIFPLYLSQPSQLPDYTLLFCISPLPAASVCPFFLDRNLQIHSSSNMVLDSQTGKTDQEKKCDANSSASSPIEKSSGTIILDEDEGSEFQEGGIRSWATVIGA